MKIEKLSENQVRFTLWNSDLEDEDLQISDLATDRSEKAERMIHHMMERARDELGFDASGANLMIEAMQVNQECIVFLVTKVDGDTKVDPKYEYIRKLQEAIKNNAESLKEKFGDVVIDLTSGNETAAEKPEVETPVQETRDKKKASPYVIYTFTSLDSLIKVSKLVEFFYDSDNTLYKSPDDDLDYLMATWNRNTEEEFNIVVKSLREFGKVCTINYGSKYYVDEHYKCIIKKNALQTLCHL